jgi:hypothetical protein
MTSRAAEGNLAHDGKTEACERRTDEKISGPMSAQLGQDCCRHYRFAQNDGVTSRAACRPGRAMLLTSALHLHDLIHGHHVLVQVRHDPERAADQHENDRHAEGKRHDVVDVVGAGRDVEKEDEMNASSRQSR